MTATISLYVDEYSTYWKIFTRIKERSVVLDVGVGSGVLGELLIKFKKAEVYGIDVNEVYAKEAIKKGYKNVLLLDLDSMKDEDLYKIFREKMFDYIVFADVLEHLKDPLNVLLRLKPLLKDNGHYIVSIPNVAVWYVRLKLLFGIWEYQDKGILDRTHLRFFTIRSARELIENAGFKIVWKDYTLFTPYIHIPYTFSFLSRNYKPRRSRHNVKKALKRILQILAKLRPSLFAMQIVIDAVPLKSNVNFSYRRD